MNIFKVLSTLDLLHNEYVIVGGAVMEAHGLKLTEDIDIVVTKKLFDQCLQNKEWIESVTPHGKKKLKKYLNHEHIKKVELYLDVNTRDFNPSFHDLLKRSTLINGFSFISFSVLINFKKAYARPKDFLDLDLIKP